MATEGKSGSELVLDLESHADSTIEAIECLAERPAKP